MTSLKLYLRSLALLTVLASAYAFWAAPWHLLECGADEGMEFSKIQLLLRHPELVKIAWNDQSWFYSQIFAAIFSITGFFPGIPRLTTLAITAGVLFTFPRFMPRNAGWPHLICAWLFFWCWPEMPYLSVSAMLEMPAVGLAVIAAALTPRDRSEWRLWRFICAGALLAVAAQIKLTALIILPALAIKMAWLLWREIRTKSGAETSSNSVSQHQWWLAPTAGFAAFGCVYILIALWSPDWDLAQLLGSHLAAGATAQADKYRLEPADLFQSPGLLTAALLGIVLLWRMGRLNEVIFPLVLLITVFSIHIVHRPWWYYYGIHFAIPLAVLGGWGAAELLRISLQSATKAPADGRPVFNAEMSMILGALAISLWAGFELARGYEKTMSISQSEKIADNDAVNVLKKYREQGKWAFTQHNLLAVYAGFVLPPELTVLPKKRYWTGQIDDQKVLEIVKRYGCEILILNKDRQLKDKAWEAFVENGYVNVWSGESECVFVAKQLNPVAPSDREGVLKNLGI